MASDIGDFVEMLVTEHYPFGVYGELPDGARAFLDPVSMWPHFAFPPVDSRLLVEVYDWRRGVAWVVQHDAPKGQSDRS